MGKCLLNFNFLGDFYVTSDWSKWAKDRMWCDGQDMMKKMMTFPYRIDEIPWGVVDPFPH